MTDRIFDAIDEVYGEGIGSALKVIEVAAATDGNYTLSRKAKYLLKQMELGLFEEKEEPEDARPKTEDGQELPTKDSGQENEGVQDEQEEPKQSEAKQALEQASKQFHSEAGDRYKADEKLKEAANELSYGGREREAIDLYLQDGSEDSLGFAAILALSEEVKDYKLGLDLFLKVYTIGQAFDQARETFNHSHSQEEAQRWEEYVLRATYSLIIDSVKTKVEEKTGKRPEAETLPQLLEAVDDKEILTSAYRDLDNNFVDITLVAKKSADPEILQLGIDFINFRRESTHREYEKDIGGSDLLYLKAKLTGKDEYIHAIFEEAEKVLETEGRGWNTPAQDVVDILSHYKRDDEALAVAERFLPTNHHKRLDLLRKSGDNQRLARVYREIGDHINYVMAIFGKPE